MIKHLALIMDGNRRWAKARRLQPWLGHDAGAKAINEAIQFCIQEQISYLSLYAFSLENFKRSPEETSFLFDLFLKILKKNEEKIIIICDEAEVRINKEEYELTVRDMGKRE